MKYYMAPLEDVTGYVYRSAYHRYFYPMDKYFSPFIAAKPNEGRLFSYKEKHDILPEHNEGLDLVPQILTNSAHDFIRTARGLEDYGYQEINLNLGCPSKPVVKGGRGSGFLEKRKDLDSFLDEIFSRTRQKISIKTRVGRYEPEEIEPLMEIFNQYPLEELIVHPRIQTDYYQGKPRMESFAWAYRNSQCPVCYNGDIFAETDGDKIQKEFPKLDRLMMGRGVLADPSLPGKMQGEPVPCMEQWKAFLEQLHDDFCRISINDEKALFKLKEIWCYLRFSFPLSDVWENGIKRAENLQQYETAVARMIESYPGLPGGAFCSRLVNDGTYGRMRCSVNKEKR